MSRKEIFAGNWKMNKTYSGAVELVRELLNNLTDIGNREVVIFPPSPYVKDMAAICENSPIKVGMQNMHYEKAGAFTGEVSPEMVKDTGASYILIGHSERRHIFGETDEDVNRKVKAALEYDLIPMICVGELLDQREKGHTDDVIKKQVEAALEGISGDDVLKVVFAYEPVWAIGTGKVATPDMAGEVHSLIRKLLSGIFNDEISISIPVLYGGSVKPDNIKGLYKIDDIDGVLVGGASLSADSFIDIISVK